MRMWTDEVSSRLATPSHVTRKEMRLFNIRGVKIL